MCASTHVEDPETDDEETEVIHIHVGCDYKTFEKRSLT